MIRCTIELIPHGVEEKKRVIGLVEIANKGGNAEVADYVVTLQKSAPWRGMLKDVWKRGEFRDGAGKFVEYGKFEGFYRQERGPYDLLYRALKAVVGERNKE